MRGYTTKEVAELLNISASRVRAFARAGVLSASRGPRGEYRFSFQDIILMRAAKELSEARIHPRKIWRALRTLRDQLPGGQSLAGIRIAADGDHVIVRDQDMSWIPESGQATLDFSVSDLADRVTPLVRDKARAVRADEDARSDDWYNVGVDFEALGATEDAKKAYRQAIALDAGNTDAYVNLGRLLHAEGRVGEALKAYRHAVESAPNSAIAYFNLGVALDDIRKPTQAMDAYRHAIKADPEFADAHYNLADLYERSGDKAGAVRHLSRYKTLTRKD